MIRVIRSETINHAHLPFERHRTSESCFAKLRYFTILRFFTIVKKRRMLRGMGLGTINYDHLPSQRYRKEKLRSGGAVFLKHQVYQTSVYAEVWYTIDFRK